MFIGAKRVPASQHAPQVGQKAPDFTLLDSNRKPVSLSQLVASSPRGVILIFYRGYW
jgi:peroxiredoxin